MGQGAVQSRVHVGQGAAWGRVLPWDCLQDGGDLLRCGVQEGTWQLKLSQHLRVTPVWRQVSRWGVPASHGGVTWGA